MNDSAMAASIEGTDELAEKTELETLVQHGITRVPAAVYLVGGYRYSSLADAVAQARRGAKSS